MATNTKRETNKENEKKGGSGNGRDQKDQGNGRPVDRSNDR